MQDNPNEKSKPRFLAPGNRKDTSPGGYQGRFLNRQPADTPAEPSIEEPIDEPVEEPASPLPRQAADAEGPAEPDFSPDAASPVAPETDTASPETLFDTDSGDFSDQDAPSSSEAEVLPPDMEFGGFEEPLDPGYAVPADSDYDEYSEYTDAAQPSDEPGSEEDAEFQELFHAPQEEAEVPQRSHPAAKGRPKHRGGEGFLGIPNILVTLVWIAITVSIGVTLGRMIWVCAADVLAFGREDHKVTITISTTDDIDKIAQKLKSAGLIRYPGLFKLYASFAVDDGEIQPGIWELNTLYDYHALVNMMSPSSSRSVVTIMIPEGSSCRQIFQLLEEKRVCTVEALESYAASGDLGDHWFLEGITRGDKYCLEGYLFPDTYEFYTNDSAENVLTKMLNNFDNRVDESVRGQLDSLNEHLAQLMRGDGRADEYISSHLFSMSDVITVASLIEKESASAQESYTIASVIYNRLFAWGSTPAYLNIDAAVIYGLDGKTDLTQEDLQTDTAYNTYLHTGLTPGPITNPGLNSIKAALDPQDTNYYYYILDPAAGTHHFSSTLEEHEAFREAIRG